MKCSIFLLIFFAHEGFSLFFILGEKENRCFFEDYQDDVLLKLHFFAGVEKKATRIGLVVTVVGPQREVMLKKEYMTSSLVTFRTSEPGEYAICVGTNSTKWAMYATETVMVHFLLDAEYVHDDEQAAIGKPKKRKVKSKKTSEEENEDDELESADDTPLANLEKRLHIVKKDVLWISEMQLYYRRAETKFREMAETTNSRVLIWASVQLFLLLATGWFQMRSLTAFFKKKKLV